MAKLDGATKSNNPAERSCTGKGLTVQVDRSRERRNQADGVIVDIVKLIDPNGTLDNIASNRSD